MAPAVAPMVPEGRPQSPREGRGRMARHAAEEWQPGPDGPAPVAEPRDRSRSPPVPSEHAERDRYAARRCLDDQRAEQWRVP